MGNCQAVDAAAVAVIQHPDGRVENSSCPLSASDIMAANSGHYVAVIMTVTYPRSSSSSASASARHRSSRRSGGGDGKQVRYLQLLRLDDTLLVGHFYRLVSFEDVLREFGSKRRVRLSKLLTRKEKELGKQCEEANPSSSMVEGEQETIGSGDSRNSVRVARKGQWRPALQTIAEADSFK